MGGRGPVARQGGAALVAALLVAFAVLVLAVSAARAALNAAKSSRAERDRHTAFAAAEAALADAERDIAGVAATSPQRRALFGAAAAAFPGDCGRGADHRGLCTAAPPAALPAWQRLDLAADDEASVALGSFTGAKMATGRAPLPARLPRYIIELVPQPAAAQGAGALFRITAIGFGARATTRVVLQSYYRTPPAGLPGGQGGNESATGLPAGRLGWREVANWSDLHEAAIQ